MYVYSELTVMTKSLVCQLCEFHFCHRGMGGTTGRSWQKTLREECINNEVSVRDVTNDPSYDWEQLLRSAKREVVANIIGHCIFRVVFRIIGTEVDPNYNKVDVHGRHIFEFIRKDGSAMLVHYHKSL